MDTHHQTKTHKRSIYDNQHEIITDAFLSKYPT